MNRERIDWINVILIATSFFVVGLIVGYSVAQTVYGIELPSQYMQVVEITEDATNTTNGMMIDNYVQNIKEDICPTLKPNITAYQGCMNI